MNGRWQKALPWREARYGGSSAWSSLPFYKKHAARDFTPAAWLFFSFLRANEPDVEQGWTIHRSSTVKPSFYG
jgi:hypothetical protein